jgi:putative ABC transport system substrate-binding protein
VRRRAFVRLIGVAAIAGPLVVRAQEPPTGKVRRIVALLPSAPGDPNEPHGARAKFTQTLEYRGWTDGGNLRIDYRWHGGDPDRARVLAKELVSLAPDAILVVGSPAVAALREETQSIPIVFVNITDPVGQGFVTSLAHPGGNITGFTDFDPTMGTKWLELVKEIAPGITRVVVIFNPNTAPYAASFLRSIEAAGPAFAVSVTAAPVHDAPEIERAITLAGREPNGALIVASEHFMWLNRALIISLAAQHRLPAVYPFRGVAESGALLSYGVDVVEQYVQAAIYIDRILKGAKPGDLPVQAPTKFILAINLKTAKAIGLTIPPSIMVQADEVIE